MEIQLNGETCSFNEGITVAMLLDELAIRTEKVAVEINLEILEKGDFQSRLLQEGDRVEVMSFIGGGQR